MGEGESVSLLTNLEGTSRAILVPNTIKCDYVAIFAQLLRLQQLIVGATIQVLVLPLIHHLHYLLSYYKLASRRGAGGFFVSSCDCEEKFIVVISAKLLKTLFHVLHLPLYLEKEKRFLFSSPPLSNHSSIFGCASSPGDWGTSCAQFFYR